MSFPSCQWRTKLMFWLVTAAILGAAFYLSAATPFHEPATISLFLPLLWGLLMLPPAEMVLLVAVISLSRAAVEAIQDYSADHDLSFLLVAQEAVFPVILIIAIGIIIYVFRRRAHRITQKLVEAKAIEAMAMLAKGLAHDFNNKLMIIAGTSEMLRHNVNLDSQAKRDVANILVAAEQGAALVRQMKSFSNQAPAEPEDHDLSELVRREMRVLERVMPSGIAVDYRLTHRPLPVRLDVCNWDRVLVNLCMNAKAAMPGGGRLTVQTDRVIQDDRQWAAFTISDTGVGIERESLDHVFEPFFTTGPAHSSMGLGLTIVRSIVQDHHGRITVASEIGKGTIFTIYLPIRPEGPRP